jgi:hypothetical protein
MPIFKALTGGLLAAAICTLNQVCQAAGTSSAPSIESVALRSDAQGRTAGDTTATYLNVRYDYSVDYPRDLLTPGEEAADGDGLEFSAKSSKARIAVWGKYNAIGYTPKQLLRSEEHAGCAEKPVSYEVAKKTFVAFSCQTSKSEIFYEKIAIRGDTLVTVQFVYPSVEEAKWAPIIKQMGASLRIEADR